MRTALAQYTAMNAPSFYVKLGYPHVRISQWADLRWLACDVSPRAHLDPKPPIPDLTADDRDSSTPASPGLIHDGPAMASQLARYLNGLHAGHLAATKLDHLLSAVSSPVDLVAARL